MLTGGCQCGANRYEIIGKPFAVVACHCTECQSQSGSAFGMSLVVSPDSITWPQKKTSSFIRPADSGKKVVCHFCSDCGTRLVHEPEYEVAVLNVRAGTLDDTTELRPIAHTWVKSKQPWDVLPHNALHYQKQPSSDEFIADLKKLQG